MYIHIYIYINTVYHIYILFIYILVCFVYMCVFIRCFYYYYYYWDGIIPARFIQPFGSEMICDPSPISHMTLQVDASRWK